MSLLTDHGWNLHWQRLFASHAKPGTEPGRVLAARRGVYDLLTARGRCEGVASGRLRHLADLAAGPSGLPAVGDWVALRRDAAAGRALVEALLPRTSTLSRKEAGARAVEQVVAANVDVVFFVMGLDGDFNLRRLERFLAMAAESGAAPVVVLNKADLCDDPAAYRAQVEATAPGVPVAVVTATTNELEDLEPHLRPGRTGALLGSSGVGKSTLINRLLGREAMTTREVRVGDDRGRHTTTRRELFRLPTGALLIDNPGVREIQLWGSEGIAPTFEDIKALAASCRFRDCRHGREPGCAVQAAIEAGGLDPGRLASFFKLLREAEALARRQDERSRRETERQQGRLYKRIQAEKRPDRGRDR